MRRRVNDGYEAWIIMPDDGENRKELGAGCARRITELGTRKLECLDDEYS